MGACSQSPRPPSAGSTDARHGRAAGVGLMLGSALANQSGAAVGALAFPVIGPLGVVAVRQWVAGVTLLLLARPEFRRFTRSQWIPVMGLAAIFAAMNLTLYVAVDRIGLGSAVTLEFLGPLAIGLAGTLTWQSSRIRRIVTGSSALFAVTGVALLSRPQPTSDYFGVALGLLAAACWAGYILLNRTVGERFVGVEGCAAACAVSAAVYAPVGVVVLIAHPPTPGALVCGITAGLLASVIPFIADVLALRRVSTHFFGIFMSVNPVCAAVIGTVVLGDALGALDWLAIVLIALANVGAGVSSAAGPTPGSGTDRIADFRSTSMAIDLDERRRARVASLACRRPLFRSRAR